MDLRRAGARADLNCNACDAECAEFYSQTHPSGLAPASRLCTQQRAPRDAGLAKQIQNGKVPAWHRPDFCSPPSAGVGLDPQPALLVDPPTVCHPSRVARRRPRPFVAIKLGRPTAHPSLLWLRTPRLAASAPFLSSAPLDTVTSHAVSTPSLTAIPSLAPSSSLLHR